ncbi:MAG TPA: hypothetical protein VHG72_21850 [Polyangia bacterium]|nr:hypothetical protein [Polyangia bacterium]
MRDRPLTIEELDLLMNFGVAGPVKINVVELRCHPDDEGYIRALFDCPIVVDPSIEPGRYKITPLAYAENVTATIGFKYPPVGH